MKIRNPCKTKSQSEDYNGLCILVYGWCYSHFVFENGETINAKKH